MCGGGPWGPGEWTDDTQMALLIAGSLLDHDGLDVGDIFRRFRAWLAAGPKDVGISTREVLSSGRSWDRAAAEHFAAGNRAAGNGSLMRTTPAAIYFAPKGTSDSVDAARRISALTHGDPAAGDGCAIFHRLLRAALDGTDPLAELDVAIRDIPADRRTKWQRVLAADWTPKQATEPNGAVWPTLATAVWALRRYKTFEQSMREVIDIGGDTDTIAAVSGGLLGAVHGIQSIPSRWTTVLHGQLPGHHNDAPDLAGLMALADRLDGHAGAPDFGPADPPVIEPREVEPGLWLANLPGVQTASPDTMVISLCRTFGRIRHELRRQVYLTDDDSNLDLQAVLNDVIGTIEAARNEHRPVLVHCFGGESRTGLILRAWLARSHQLTPSQATAEAMRLWPATARWNSSFEHALEVWADAGTHR